MNEERTNFCFFSKGLEPATSAYKAVSKQGKKELLQMLNTCDIHWENNKIVLEKGKFSIKNCKKLKRTSILFFLRFFLSFFSKRWSKYFKRSLYISCLQPRLAPSQNEIFHSPHPLSWNTTGQNWIFRTPLPPLRSTPTCILRLR